MNEIAYLSLCLLALLLISACVVGLWNIHPALGILAIVYLVNRRLGN